MGTRGCLRQSSGSVLFVHLIFIQLHHIEMALADIEQFRNIFGSNDVTATKSRALVLSGNDFSDVVRKRMPDSLFH
jgi:hypothetical protein